MIKVYSKNNCPHCINAKQFLENKNINYQEINIETDTEAREFILSQGHKSVPQIYVGDRLLVSGGWQGLSKLTTEQILDRINNNTLGIL